MEKRQKPHQREMVRIWIAFLHQERQLFVSCLFCFVCIALPENSKRSHAASQCVRHGIFAQRWNLVPEYVILNLKFQPMVLPLQVVGHPRHRGHDRSLPRLCLPLEVVLHRACFQPAFVGCLRRHHGASGQVSSHVHFPSQTKPGRALFERPCRVCFFALFSGPAPFCRSRDPGCPAQPG